MLVECRLLKSHYNKKIVFLNFKTNMTPLTFVKYKQSQISASNSSQDVWLEKNVLGNYRGGGGNAEAWYIISILEAKSLQITIPTG